MNDLMRVLVLALLTLSTIWISPAKAAPLPIKPESAKKIELLVRFHNGSTLKMAYAGDKLTFLTKYGTLLINIQDIKRIDFARRIPEKTQAEITAAVRNLGNKNFNERKVAFKNLKEFGALAYPDLLEAEKDKDENIRNQAKELLDTIRAEVRDEEVLLRTRDIIYTDDSMFSGLIEKGSLPTTTEQFGPLELKLQYVTQILFLNDSQKIEIKLDGQYAKKSADWFDTGLQILAEIPLKLSATGEIDMYATGGYEGQYVGTPRGKKVWPGATGTPEPGTLLGKIGKDGQEFTIGADYHGTPQRSGILFLKIAGNPYDVTTKGEYKIIVQGALKKK